MRAEPKPGDTRKFEDAPGITVEENVVVNVFDSVDIHDEEPTVYRDVIRASEDISGDGVTGQKLYAPGLARLARSAGTSTE